MLLEEMVRDIPGVTLRGAASVHVTGLTQDSRQVEPGFLFVAVRGARSDGNAYIPEALARGALAVASENVLPAAFPAANLTVPDPRRFLAEASRIYYGDPASRMKLVAITGTNGKTTTSYLLDSIFRHAGIRSCLAGTLGLKIGGRRWPSTYTTPEAPELTAFLRKAVDSGCTHGVMEVSSHALASKRVFGTRFVAGIFTNLTPEHLDFHGDMESYYAAKLSLFTREGGNGIEAAIVNTDDSWGRRLTREAECRVTRYGQDPSAEVRLLSSRMLVDGTDIEAATPLGAFACHTPLIGTPNVYNVLSALAAALGLELNLPAIREGIEAVEGIAGRMEKVDAGQDFTVVVDYAHTPDALEKLLRTVRELPHNRIITLFGCGGDRDRVKRPLMGEIAGRLSDQVVATSDNPRSEDPLRILSEIEPGLRPTGTPYTIDPDRRGAIGAALSAAQTGDVVVLAGKGHEDYQIVGTQVLPFDDRLVAREFILELGRQRKDPDPN